ncbi:LysM peptidoglycan-binding domain-containing protein [Dokdonia sp. Hel_I_53]|uniref:amino acid ABC transporter substrate-binding protein n=1 Tax=Dokdonia sp. Hel_I_53 TaxID=1566287 RepID=UPI00119B13D5|nr:LysM peptidoglycan-binding domain-containing protein [Dokdonia sp. Hel_I_53]TVZ51656.1 amino acid/amide ABC transporter substrate-binding protein (HAAT family) [Dokdonia sp. Hel_I_53]
MKNYLIIGIVIFCCAFAKACTSSAPLTKETQSYQKFVSHQVEKGETVGSISKKYNIDQADITKLNPDAKNGIYEGLVLILPASASISVSSQKEVLPLEKELKFKIHKVKRKEGLYGISKEYGVPQDVIKKYNKQLYSGVLRKGDKIRIPINYAAVIAATSETLPQEGEITSDGYLLYKVLAKETKYGIARKYGISIAELETLNPEVKEGLQEGVIIKVPQGSFSNSAIIDSEKYGIYEVQKGNTIYSLLRLFQMEADELLSLNPALDDGLKEGMVLVVPKGTPGSINPQVDNEMENPMEGEISQSQKVSLLDSLNDFSTKRIAIMLPFGVDRIRQDSAKVNERLLKDDRILRLSLDLYSGMLMAVSDAKKAGISTIIDTYDTSYDLKDGAATNARKVESIVLSNNFQDTKAVIGPLLGNNINRVSTLLSDRNIPVISPISSNVLGDDNVFISKPNEDLLRDKMLSYLKMMGEGKNIVVIADSKNTASRIKIKSIFPNAKSVEPRSGEKGLYLYTGDVAEQLSDELENWVILESNDIPLISNVTTSLNAQVGVKKVVLFTTNKGNAYDSDEIQHTHLRNLQFHFPSVNKEYKYATAKKFVNTYEDMYGISPSDNAIRGYDLMFDTILRVTYANDLYNAAMTGVETDYVENKFRYGRNVKGGFINDAVYLLKYNDDLKLEEVTFLEPVLE